jgi:hypothetical protein
MVGTTVTLEMNVAAVAFDAGARDEDFGIVLLSRANPRGRGFIVELTGKATKAFDGKTPAELRQHFRGRTVRVEGQVSMRDDHPRIVVTDPSRYKLAPKK